MNIAKDHKNHPGHTFPAGVVCCFGELLLRMSPVLNGQWIDRASMPVYIGGAELNVGTALANWDVPVRYVTALPSNYLSREITADINRRKIDTAFIQTVGQRIGTYYLPQGADLKHAGVIYDRAHSAFADLELGMIDWQSVLNGCSWFHFSAISPALTEQAATVCLEAVKAAADMGLTISVDLNYRSKLWQYGNSPVSIMPAMVEYCDVVMGNLWAAESLLGISSPVADSRGKTRDELIDAAGKSMLALHHRFSKIKSIAYTFRLEDHYWAVLQHGTEHAVSKTFGIGEVIDKVGSGDCFMGGLIHGLYHGQTPVDIINFAAAAAVGKLHETGDATRQTKTDVYKRLTTTTN